jgi:hypothetical protein
MRPGQHITIFELLEMIVAVGLVRWASEGWLGDLPVPLRWTAMFLGTAVTFLAILYLVSWGLDLISRRKSALSPRVNRLLDD